MAHNFRDLRLSIIFQMDKHKDQTAAFKWPHDVTMIASPPGGGISKYAKHLYCHSRVRSVRSTKTRLCQECSNQHINIWVRQRATMTCTRVDIDGSLRQFIWTFWLLTRRTDRDHEVTSYAYEWFMSYGMSCCHVERIFPSKQEFSIFSWRPTGWRFKFCEFFSKKKLNTKSNVKSIYVT